jgi:predicted transcriptional regulator
MSLEEPQDPTPGELDCLAVLWEARELEQKDAMKLSEIHERVGKRRQEFGEPPPALTTVSTYLRSATSKRLLEEVRRDESGNTTPMVAIRTRGALSSSRSPRTAYKVSHEPGVVLHRTMQAIIQAYPPGKRHQALGDFARAMGLPPKTVEEIKKLVAEKKVK